MSDEITINENAPVMQYLLTPEQVAELTTSHTNNESEGPIVDTCNISDCTNPQDEGSLFCGSHRCVGITAKGNRCKSSVNCKINHKTQPNSEEENMNTESIEPVYFGGYGPEYLQKGADYVKAYVAAQIEAPMLRLKEKHGDNLVVVSTMHEGFQTALARIAIRNDIKLLAIVANPGFARRYWGAPNKLKNGKEVGSLTGAENRGNFALIIQHAWKELMLSDSINVEIGNGETMHSLQFRDNQVSQMLNYCIVYDLNDINTKRGLTAMKSHNVPTITIEKFNSSMKEVK